MSALQCVQGCEGLSGHPAVGLPRSLAASLVATVKAERVDAVHAAPVWRERADFVIGARLPEEGRAEQLWARRIEGRHFEVCCIPFFLYDVALGDVVETDADYDLERVV